MASAQASDGRPCPRASWAGLGVALAAPLLAALPVLAGEVLLPAPGSDGWRPLPLPKVERRSTYTAVEEDGLDAVRAESRCSASGLTFPLEGIELADTPLLRWRWKIERGLAISDERVKAGDDFAARVYVLFRFEPERASLWARVRNKLGRSLYGSEVPGNALNYVWTGSLPAGTTWPNPFVRASWMISLGKGTLSDWRPEEVNVAADYLTHFGHNPPAVIGLAVMSDSDNSCQEAVAYFADFRFVGGNGSR